MFPSRFPRHIVARLKLVRTLTTPPSPPRLPPKDQATFERLQHASSAPTQPEEILHPDARRGAAPEFEGDTNPKTGEVGGPKNDPLRHGDYSYNGRVTDF
ncbi:hypothetical protein Q9L58_000021 [Maublancomyces gigas]|uniref:Succinate dehydrogenase assembly factor 4, mitochondrial n=1 Tax=Discina gigas TaxID=1032678 RepID=A0ABR3GXT8_9PEZI